MMTRSSWQWAPIAILISSTTATALSPTYNVVIMVMDDARPAQRYAYVRFPYPSPSTAFTLLVQLGTHLLVWAVGINPQVRPPAIWPLRQPSAHSSAFVTLVY